MTNTRAFSLVELSIVLVIIGLLVGGVIVGKSVMRASEMRGVTAEYQRYITAMSAFHEKYGELPGDMPNATSYWGTAAACPGINSTAVTQPTTCNGDGNAVLSPGAAGANEIYRFWQHLANAGLIEGKYSGTTNSGTASDQVSLIGTNSPQSRMSGAGWTIYGVGGQSYTTQTQWFDGYYGNVFIFGGAEAGGVTESAILRPDEAWSIDSKIDDGYPGTGKIVTYELTGPNCSDTTATSASNIALTARYKISNPATTCMLVFKTGF